MFTTTIFRPSNLSRETAPWGREVEQRIQDLERTAARGDGNNLNANKSQNSSIDLVTRNISNLSALVQNAFSTLTVDAAQVVSGVLLTARIPNLDASKITSGTITNDVSSSNVTGSNVTGANVFDQNVSFNIIAARVAVWGRTSDGLLATATSSEKAKTNIRPVDWDDAKIEAVMNMSLVYYNWIEAVEAAKVDPGVQVHQEIGFIAERMHEAGLWEFVVYERNPDDTPMLNTETKQPIPVSIHYINWALALHAVTQRLWAARKADRADIDLLLKQAGLASISTNKG